MTNAISYIAKYKVAFMFVAAAMVSFMFSPLAVSAEGGVDFGTATNTFGIGTGDSAANLGLGNESLDDAIVGLINVALGFLGLIAVIIILIGGFRWMTAGGNEDDQTI